MPAAYESMAIKTPMATREVACSVSINRAFADNDSPAEKSGNVCRKDMTDIAIEIRLQWARDIAQEFLACSNDNLIRPWAFDCSLDGTVERLALSLVPDGGREDFYPVRYRIPQETVSRLGREEKAKRSELFALGSLLYEVSSGYAPFEELSDDEVQLRYSNGEFPSDLQSLHLHLAILSCWSLRGLEGNADATYNKIVRGARSYIREHPVSFAVQTVGILVLTASVSAPPLLGIAGFTSNGPAAGSLAAVWQSSVGSVAAGSAFAWCQSVSMGGAALSGISSFGVLGGGTVAVGMLPLVADKLKNVLRRPG